MGEINQLKKQLEESELTNAQLHSQIVELEHLKTATDTSVNSREQRTIIKLMQKFVPLR